MSDQTKNPVSKIRTFASDLELQRKSRKPASKPEDSLVKSAPADRNSFPKVMPEPPKPIIKASIAEAEVVDEKKEEKIEIKKQEEVVKTKILEPALVLPKVESLPISNKMPAFHELSKHESTIQNIPSPKPLFREDPKPENTPVKQTSKLNIGLDSTIITDNKSKSFKLFPSIIQAIKNWFKSSGKKNKDQTPQYAVPETIHRKGVIQKATSKSGTIYTADGANIREQIRQRQAEAEIENLKKQQAPKEPKPSLSPYTEPGYNLLEKNNSTSNIQVEYKRTVPKAPEIPPAPVIPPVPVPPIVPTPVLETVTTTKPVEEPRLPRHEVEALIDKYKDKRKDRATGVTEPEKILPQTVLPQNVNKETSNTERLKPNRASSLSSIDTNRATLVILLIVIGIIILVVLSRVVMKYINIDAVPEATITEITPEPFIDDAKVKTIVLESENQYLLPEMLDSTVKTSSEGVSEIIIMAKSGDEVSPSYIFDLLNFRALPTLKQSLTSARFLSIDSREEMILLKFVDEITVRGGLLYWETNIQKDLETIYDLPDQVENGFTDETISGVDIRILKNEAGEDILLYSIIDNNTAIISTNREDFLTILKSELAN